MVEEHDPVNKPSHYRSGDTYETIRVIEAWGLVKDYFLGNVIKYISRAGLKNKDPLEDLKKARWYLDRKITNMEKDK